MTIKPNISLLKDIIYIGSVLIAIWFYFNDKGKKDAILETKLETVIQNQEAFFNKINELDGKFDKQAELNGKIIMYIELDDNSR
jgi:hypothetical protein